MSLLSPAAGFSHFSNAAQSSHTILLANKTLCTFVYREVPVLSNFPS